MVLKTFNLDHEVHKKFADYCKREGISMSKKIENFLRSEVEKIEGPRIEELSGEDHPISKYTH